MMTTDEWQAAPGASEMRGEMDLMDLMKSALASYEAAGVDGSEGARAMREAIARIEELERERDEWRDAATRHHPNPADHRYWEGRYRDEKAEVARLSALLKEAEARSHLYVEALSEIKATVDGQSEQPVRDIVYGLLVEIDRLASEREAQG